VAAWRARQDEPVPPREAILTALDTRLSAVAMQRLPLAERGTFSANRAE
jgi:hypothetical protein